jgi:diacylglycerol O-acyltransferase
MHRLSGKDALFLAIELPTQPIHIIVMALLRPATGADGLPVPVQLGELRRHMAGLLDQIPTFRSRVLPVPLGLNHPVLVPDREFDLDNHVRQHTLPAPGTDQQLDRLYASLAEHPLDRRRPLWDLLLVDGLESGRQAVILRTHHCLGDGFAVVNILSRILSGGGADQSPGPSATASWRPAEAPGPWWLVGQAVRDYGRSTRRLPALIRETRGNLSTLSATTEPRPSRPVAPPRAGGGAPSSAINRSASGERRFARTSFAIADVKLVKEAAGVSINDVALALVAGSLRAYLLARGQLPDRALLANVPVGMEGPGAAPRITGNRFSVMATSLATEVADPWERLGVIGAATAASKQELAASGPETAMRWLDYVVPAVVDRVVGRQNKRRRLHPEDADVNTFVTNVRGPRPGTLCSAVVEEMYTSGPPGNGVGTNVAVWDYGDRLVFTVIAIADAIDDPGEVIAGLHDALDELLAVAQSRLAVGGAPS